MQKAFIEEVATFALGKASKLTERDSAYHGPDFSFPLMVQLVRTVFLRRCEFAEWHTNLTAGSFGLPDETLTRIVANKAARAYKKANELWLAIQSTTRISELVMPLNGIYDFSAVPGLSMRWMLPF